MARSIWSGSLAFGLVNVPVALYSATQDTSVHFHQFQRGTSSRIRYKRVNADTGEEVDYADIVKGAQVGDGAYVLLTPEELEAVEPGRSRTIDISDFVDAREIDPVFYQKTYYLAPRDEAAERAYALLTRAMREADRVGIATFVMRSKQYLAALRASGDVLTLETMFFADEVRDPHQQIDTLPVQREPGTRPWMAPLPRHVDRGPRRRVVQRRPGLRRPSGGARPRGAHRGMAVGAAHG